MIEQRILSWDRSSMPKVSKKKLHTFFDYRDVWFEFPDLSANLKQVLIFRRVVDDLVGTNNFLQS